MAGAPVGKDDNQLTELWTHLYSVLDRQKDVVERMRAMAEEQLAALRTADAAKLSAVVQRQSLLADALAGLEAERSTCQRSLGTRLGLGPEPSLGELLSAAPAEQGRQLAALGEALRSVLLAFRQTNSLCRIMTHQGLRFSTLVLQSLGLREATTYGEKGEISRTSFLRVVDDTV